MLDIADPRIKRFKEILHNSVTRQRKSLSSPTGYAASVAENRLLKIFCAEKTVEPSFAAAMLESRYGYWLDGELVLRRLRPLHLNNYAKRVNLFAWAERTVEIFAEALEFREPTYFENFRASCDERIVRADGKSFQIKERVACLMLCVKHPELFTDEDCATIEKFDGEHMKIFFCDVTDFLRGVCGANKKNSFANMTLKDFLTLLCAVYPDVSITADTVTRAKFKRTTVQKFFDDATKVHAENFYTGMTVEEFLSNDPDADSLLISAPPVVSINND